MSRLRLCPFGDDERQSTCSGGIECHVHVEANRACERCLKSGHGVDSCGAPESHPASPLRANRATSDGITL